MMKDNKIPMISELSSLGKKQGQLLNKQSGEQKPNISSNDNHNCYLIGNGSLMMPCVKNITCKWLSGDRNNY